MLTTELLDVLAKKGYIHSEVPELTDDNVEETLTQVIEDIKEMADSNTTKSTENICSTLKKGNRSLISLRKKFSRLQRKKLEESKTVLDELLRMF